MRREYRLAGVASLALAGMLVTAATAYAGNDPPDWLIAASRIPTPKETDRAPAVELLRECRIQVSGNGSFVSTVRRAVRILNREGRDAAVVREYYESGSGSVRDMNAWIVRGAGKPLAYGSKDAVDVSMAGRDDLYNESRVRAIVASNDAEVGSVFGSESTVEFKQDMLQIRWFFQDRHPVVQSRFLVTVPSGWNARSVTFQHDPIEPRREGDTMVWSVANLPYLEEELWSPPVTSLAPWLAVTVVPPAGESRWNATRFEDWSGVARWLEKLAEPQTGTTPALVAKARALVEGRTTEWERIEAVAKYVQGIQYVSVQTGIARGGGYRPHAAADVFSKSYGDCKAKANLLRTMLREVGIRAHLVPITADDPDFVRKEWPSPYQFNHCITAIEVSKDIQAPAVTEVGGLRMLIFDPTASTTPLGQLPFDQQGSLALVVAGTSSALIQMPSTSATDNGVERTLEGHVSADGTLSASLRQRSLGRAASIRRSIYRAESPADYRKRMERWISSSVPGAVISKVEVKDEFQENRFTIDLEFQARGFARPLPGGLFAVRPVDLEGTDGYPLGTARRSPLLLATHHLSATTVLQIPDTFAVEECSEPARSEAAFGVFRTSCDLDGTKLRFRKDLEMKRAMIPAEKSSEALRFFEEMRSASQTSVVLAPAPATPPAPASSR